MTQVPGAGCQVPGRFLMDNYKTYRELEEWKEARILVKRIYEATKTFPKEEIYGLTAQMRRCAVSVPSNIAEGYGRKYKKETIHFLYIARDLYMN